MITGVCGRLISATFAQAELHALPGAATPPTVFIAALDVWSDRRESILGPSSSLRAITDAAVIPLLKLLGYDITGRADRAARTVLAAAVSSSASLPVAIVPWNEPLDTAWRDVVRDGIRADARWCVCCNGTALRIVDAHHTWARQYLEFDLALLSCDESLRSVFWNVMRSDAMAARPPFLQIAAEGSARHGTVVCKALGSGVLEALTLIITALRGRGSANAQALFEQSLTVLYRVLFLLFAEARALVPIWHPVYRERYTIDAIVGTLLAGRRYRGVWDAILAISRLAHAGCRAGELNVTAFNGRLFAPAYSSAFDRTRIGDDVMGSAVIAVGTTSIAGGGRGRICYGDLDVEQLGAVYERVLEYAPVAESPAVLTHTRDTRQSSGTFYTPRSVTTFLVRHTLEPLVRDRTAEEILQLRVLDPAMGSGAFLVGACRYLAAMAERSLIREGRWHPGEVTAAERAALRRDIAQRCLFGVDVNPMAVQLARLSLWLATLASDKPLTFLDHHLVVGDSLIGASVDDVRRQPTRGRREQRRPDSLPLFSDTGLTPTLEHAVRTRLRVTRQPDDSPGVVAEKARTLAALHAPQSPLGRWSKVLDLWCAGWFWEDDIRPTPAVFGDLCDRLLHGRATLPDRLTARYLDHAAELALRHRFLHWPLAFPEIFCDEQGHSLAVPGFDAVVGNPPWDMVRGDSGEAAVRAGRKLQAQRFTSFVREAGVYRVESRSHVNRYQLFAERALQFARAGGRIGLLLPSGIATDAGAAPLRRHLFSHADVDTVTGLDNRGGFFAVHRSLRFVLLTATAGQPTSSVACRFGITRTEDLEAERRPIIVTRQLLARLSGTDDLGIPEIASERDLRIVETISARTPWLGAADGWNVQFGRELNATDDRGSFKAFSGSPTARPVLEGKQIEPFRTTLRGCRYELPDGHIGAHLARRARVAYRDVASATNRLTLIAAVIPARAVTTHTLFCLRTVLPTDAQHVLCALLNSFVANYLIRLRVNTHVTASLVSRLPVPVIDSRHPAFSRLAHLSRTLANSEAPVDSMSEYAELQALAARLYELGEADFQHILDTFPLIPAEVKDNALRGFRSLH
ncbi:MAG: Eco57I restriction-modification methylase domain-containing protein [Vicinamibacterales bacterium]